MSNIWEVLLQTLTVSVTAGLLLVIKGLLQDKLSPRWQYGVWSILVLRILLPVDVTKNVLLPLPLWVETWKGVVENGLASAYSEVFVPISPESALPLLQILKVRPESVTDWLFVVYCVGVLLALLRYLISYLRLRRILRRGEPVPEEMQSKIDWVCGWCNLKCHRAVQVPGLKSAFVCGVFRPVLVLPADVMVDEKVILHELLHMKHQDSFQGMCWCLLRCLHWFNPFLWYVFDRVGNDMESLCDQRVLERLEGEELREYGHILLDMVNERYARAFGTSSLSNGGRNISRRIAAIVRFRKYPKGMALVSVCILLVLAPPVLVGTAAEYESDDYWPQESLELAGSLAMTRLNRCTTLAGALDTYAKGLMTWNGLMIASASPLEQQMTISEMLLERAEHVRGAALEHWETGSEMSEVDLNEGYVVYNLQEIADGSYEALLTFTTSHVNEESVREVGTLLIPVRIWQENDFYVVEERGERYFMDTAVIWGVRQLEPLKRLYGEGETGAVTYDLHTSYAVPNNIPNGGINLFGQTTFDTMPKPAAEFETIWVYWEVDYAGNGHAIHDTAASGTGAEALLEGPEETLDLDIKWSDSYGNHGEDHGMRVHLDGEWDGTYSSGGGSTVSNDDIPVKLPETITATVRWDGRQVDEIRLQEVPGIR